MNVIDLVLWQSRKLGKEIEFLMSNEDVKSKILQIHIRKMVIDV